MDTRFDSMDKRLDGMDMHFDGIDKRLDKLDDSMHTLKYKQNHMSEKLKGIDITINHNHYHLDNAVKKLQEDVETLAEILKIHNMIPVS